MKDLVDLPSGKIEYSIVGEGKPILFIHGGHVDCDETLFQKGLDAKAYCFITPSRPGYGSTPLTEVNKTPKDAANLVVSLLDKLKLQKVIVVGISAGGLTALEIAGNYPERVEQLILLSALTKKWFAKTDRTYKGGKKLFAPAIEKYTWLIYRFCFRLFPKFIGRIMFVELSKFHPILFTDDELDELKRITLKIRSGKGFVNDLDQEIDQLVLEKIVCPTLILHSNYDNSVDLSHPLNAKDRIRNSKLEVFSNRWGHMIWLGAEYQPYLNEIKNQIK